MVVEETGPAHRQESPPAAAWSGAVAMVRGQVKTPGEVPFTPGATLGSVIRKAGGATGFDSLRRVAVIRGGAMTRHDLTTPAGLGTPVRPGDVIEVPPGSTFGR
jgi:polysaccharide export outer membrane protein